MKKSVSLLLTLVLCLAACIVGAQAIHYSNAPLSPDRVVSEHPGNYPKMAVKGTAELNVYALAGNDGSSNTSGVVATLSPGDQVQMLKYDITGKWVRVLYNDGNNCGWVTLASLEKVK